jgi:chemotaxis family two-component system response regulator Rcp1
VFTVAVPANKSPDTKPTLLLVEDGAAEVQIVQRALRALGRDVLLNVVRDGQEAVEYLLGQGRFAGGNHNSLPDLVLLDLHMPRLDGLEVLAQVRRHPETKLLPIVVWTTSCEQDDIRAAYAAGANSYIEKPHDYERLRAILETVLRYWLDTALLP